MIPRILAFVLLTAIAACAPRSGTERMTAGSSVDIAAVATQLSVLRAGGGILRPIIHSPELQAAAEAQAAALRDAENRGQIGAGGTALSTRLQRAGYNACASAESVASGTPDIRTTIGRWMETPADRATILNPQVTQFGFAGTEQTWVLVLARPC